MKISVCDRNLSGPPPGGSALFHRRCNQASALVIVLVLLSVMTVLVVSNSLVLAQLKRELQLIEKKQNRKFEQPGVIRPLDVSNRSPASVSERK